MLKWNDACHSLRQTTTTRFWHTAQCTCNFVALKSVPMEKRPDHLAMAAGFLRTKITESPLRNILAMNLSLFTGFAFFLPFPVFGVSVHISFTFSNTMLQCLSKAFTLARSFLLFLQLMRTCVLFLTDWVRTDSGPVLNSSCSLCDSSSGVISDLGLFNLQTDWRNSANHSEENVRRFPSREERN